MILYDYYRSSASYRVRIALNLKRLEYQQVSVNLLQMEHRSAAYLQRNPQGLVPVLEDDHGLLSQSLAICEYLDEAYPGPKLLPESASGRARVRCLAQIIACEIHPMNNLRALKYLQGELNISDDQKAQWYQHWVAEGFAALEQKLSQDPETGKFCQGDQPGLVDLCLVPQMFNARRFNCELAAYPTLVRIDSACQQLQAFAAAHPDRQADSTA
ncbi:MAG: maleylacetoacetate isomerase [Motiliproteus sp.]